VTARTPDPKRAARWETTRTFRTFYGELLQMASWLVLERGVTHVAMESTGPYWWPVYSALREVGGPDLTIEVVNAAHVKAVPGRKTDVKDSQWLAQLMEVGLLRGSFLPPEQVRAMRDFTRYQTKLTEERSREKQRLLKMLEAAGIKLDNVASDTFGVSGRLMLDALVNGERDPVVLAGLARGVLRNKTDDLRLALAGRFTDHHGHLVALHLARIDHLDQMLTKVKEKIGRVGKDPMPGLVDPFAAQVELLTSIPGIGERVASVVISEPGRWGALLRPTPLRTVHASRRRTRLKQAARTLRVEVLASCVGGVVARVGRRRVSSGFVCCPAYRACPGGRGARRRSPCGRCSATSVPTLAGTGVAGPGSAGGPRRVGSGRPAW
jgi:transposase